MNIIIDANGEFRTEFGNYLVKAFHDRGSMMPVAIVFDINSKRKEIEITRAQLETVKRLLVGDDSQ